MARDYNTKQKALVLGALKQFGARAVTAEQLMMCLDAWGERVGKATVYRQLEKLLEQGKARSLPGQNGTLYQYVEDVTACQHHLHCQCTQCGSLFHMECQLLDQISGHLIGQHAFALDPGRTVLQGKCANCRKEESHGAIDPGPGDAGL